MKCSFDDFEAFPFTKGIFPSKIQGKNTQKKQTSIEQKKVFGNLRNLRQGVQF